MGAIKTKKYAYTKIGRVAVNSSVVAVNNQLPYASTRERILPRTVVLAWDAGRRHPAE
jgi:hypothetical protein